MKSVFVFLIMFVSLQISAQTTPARNCKTLHEGSFKQSEDKKGKTTTKECLFVIVCDDAVEFRITNTSVKTFYLHTGTVWINGSNKIIQRVVQTNGLIVFHDGKAAFAYTPTTNPVNSGLTQK